MRYRNKKVFKDNLLYIVMVLSFTSQCISYITVTAQQTFYMEGFTENPVELIHIESSLKAQMLHTYMKFYSTMIWINRNLQLS